MGPPRGAPRFLKEVWSPMGGWYCDPVFWRRNTALGLLGAMFIVIPAFFYSAKLEERPNYPLRSIPSQIWCKNFPEPPETKDKTEEIV